MADNGNQGPLHKMPSRFSLLRCLRCCKSRQSRKVQGVESEVKNTISGVEQKHSIAQAIDLLKQALFCYCISLSRPTASFAGLTAST